MAKRTKTAARAGKVKGPTNGPEWKPLEPKELMDEEVDSDDGSFLDDEDLGDFLPAAWTTGNTHNKKKNENTSISSSTKLSHTTTSVETKVECTGSTVVNESANTQQLVPTPPLHDSTVEDLREQIKSLKEALFLKDSYIAAEAKKSRLHAHELLSLRNKYNETEKLRTKELLSLKTAYNDAEAERMRATDGHRKLLNTNTALKLSNEELKKKWASAKFKFEQVEKELEVLKKDKATQDAIIKQVRRQAQEGVEERKRLEVAAAAAERLKNITRADYDKLISENQILKAQVQQSSTSKEKNHDWKLKCQKLRMEHKGREKSLEAAQIEIVSLQHEVTDLKIHRGSVERKLDITLSELTIARTTIQRHVVTMKELKSDIAKLEGDGDLKAPLLQIGVNIRLRNFEHARETLFGISRSDVDRSIIANGNVAAHSANGAVDASMFKAGLIPEVYLEEATEVFERMYQIEPSKYGSSCPKYLRLADCRATLDTLKAFRGRNGNASAHLRDQHDDIDGRLTELHSSLSRREFEADKEVGDLIERLEFLTTEIVQVDRSRGSRH